MYILILLLNPGDLHYFITNKPDGCDRFVFSFSPAFSDTLSTSSTNLLDCFYLRRQKTCHLLPIPQDRLKEFLRLAETITALSARPYREYGEDLLRRLEYGQLLLSVNRVRSVGSVLFIL